MPSGLLELTAPIALDPKQFIGIPIALVGAVFLSLGAQFQHRGVAKVEANTGEADKGLNVKQLLALLARPSWVIGTLMLGLAIVFQLTSLGFSPIIVVQPLGAVALVITAVLNSRVSKVKLNRSSVISIVLCVGGVGLFVLVAAFTARDKPVTTRDLIVILVILSVVLLLFAVAFVFLRKKFKAIAYIVGAGVLYGFVATLAKVVISRLFQEDFGWLTILALAGLLAAAALGGYFVQNAYASGPPDLVIAGLTVIDPLVAVAIGITVLGEASQAPPWALVAYVLFGLVAILGVFGLARFHPQAKR
ncbi:DMT family transporter [Herbiconiux moechotypicola]|uniref:Multidrug DMT transporter permease n=1 Tax=Herbiconiux moechotypicola TaxID=637393 RepID=A0ABN3D6V8_9MICO|nr:DMT family transporter [Herbiconiux moechotypicola]MCS5728512.1 DMT family transporter [Herbiconiux moechotypicola]